MNEYLSYGAGVNSTALLILLDKWNTGYEAIFANHKTDLPETYEYVKYLKSLGYKITEIFPNYQGFTNLYEYCKAKKFLPSIFLRWCTYRFKLKPLWKYVEKPCVMYIGISYEEKKRVKAYKKNKMNREIEYEYPLIDEKIDRKKCIRMIEKEGLQVPVKSGCFICPFQSRTQLIWLYNNHRDLFEKLVDLEKIRSGRHTLKEKPIQHYVPYNNLKLDRWII